MTAIHEQLVRDHVGQLIRDARSADRVKRAHRVGRRHADHRGHPETRQLRRCDPAAPRPA